MRTKQKEEGTERIADLKRKQDVSLRNSKNCQYGLTYMVHLESIDHFYQKTYRKLRSRSNTIWTILSSQGFCASFYQKFFFVTFEIFLINLNQGKCTLIYIVHVEKLAQFLSKADMVCSVLYFAIFLANFD